MRSPLWAVAVALPLILGGCGKKEESKVVDTPAPATTEPKPDDVVSNSPAQPAFTAEQKEKIRAPLLKLAKKPVDDKPAFAAVPTTAAATTTSRWADVLGDDQPIHYAHCIVAAGDDPYGKDCHLFVKPTVPGQPGKPVRWLKFEKNNDGTLRASIRSEADPTELMTCDSLAVDESHLSGWCKVEPHTGSGSHWFEFAVFPSSGQKRQSLYYVYFDDEPKGDGSDVHNGEGHGGTE